MTQAACSHPDTAAQAAEEAQACTVCRQASGIREAAPPWQKAVRNEGHQHPCTAYMLWYPESRTLREYPHDCQYRHR